MLTKMILISRYFFFVHSYVAAKIEKKGKKEEKVTVRLKINLSNQIIDWWWDCWKQRIEFKIE